MNPRIDPNARYIASKEHPLADIAYGSLFYKRNGRWYACFSFRHSRFANNTWEKLGKDENTPLERALRAGKIQFPTNRD
jgi:hypothetical protein